MKHSLLPSIDIQVKGDRITRESFDRKDMILLGPNGNHFMEECTIRISMVNPMRFGKSPPPNVNKETF